ncbi:MAG TPA: hypothetical protein VKQ29_11100 [Aliidongia sp.]|nr:hypothetical protein [Aliidongia sp.]
MTKLMMTVGSLALMAAATTALAQSSNGPASAPTSVTTPSTPPAPSATAPGVTAPNNSSTNMPMDMAPSAPMSSKDSTSAVSPAQSNTSSGTDGAIQKPTKMSHKTHGMKQGTSKASGSKSTDHDADQLNQQELGKLQTPN